MLGRALVGIAIATAIAHADEFANSPTRPGYEPSDHVFDFALRDELDKNGFTVGLTYSLDVFAAPQLDTLQMMMLRDRTVGVMATRMTIVF